MTTKNSKNENFGPLSYIESGHGRPVVLIHAFPLSLRMWSEQISKLSKSRRVIAVDLPGFGGSRPREGVSIAQMAGLINDLLDFLEVREPVFLGGVSMGGYVVFEFLRQFPQRIEMAGLFSTRPGADSAQIRERRTNMIEAINREGVATFAKKITPNLLGKTSLTFPQLVSKVENMILTNKTEGIIAGIRAMANRNDSTGLLQAIKCPVLIVAGEEDAFIPVAEAEKMHQKIPGSVLEIIPRSGHLVNLEHPLTFNGLLENFIQHHGHHSSV